MKIDGFEQKDSQGFQNSYNSYEQYPLEKFFIFTIYQNYTLALIFILYCMAMRGIPEYIALARTILHASVGQVQYGPSAGNIFWYPPNIKPCNIIIIIHIRHFV